MAFSKLIRLVVVCLSLVTIAMAQSITIVSGNGQLALQSTQATQPLSILVKDTAGAAVANTTVTWAVTGGGTILPCAGFTLTNNQQVTDATGKACVTFITPSISFAGGTTAFGQSTVTASALNATASFTETAIGTDPTGIPLVQAQLVYPSTADLPLIGQAGQKNPTQLKATVNATGGFGGAGQAIPNVAVRIDAPDPTTSPSISCSQGNTIYTDSTGTATCDLVFGGKLGSGVFSVSIGEYLNFGNKTFQVNAGQFGLIRILSGDNQSGTPGSAINSPLLAILSDLGGNPVSGVSVLWEVTSGTATLTNQSTVSDSTGRVSARVVLGNSAGPVKIRLSAPGTTVTPVIFTVGVNIVVTGLQKVSGDSQNAFINTDFAQPLVVQVNGASGAVQGAPVVFAIPVTPPGTATAGTATLGTPNATTDAQGRASTTVHAGATAGTITITATSGTFNQTFTLVVQPPGPVFTSNSFFTSAGLRPGGVSPGNIVRITAAGVATGVQGCVNGAGLVGGVPLQVANVTVQFGTSSAPIYNVCNLGTGQEFVTVQVPFDITAPGTVAVTIKSGTGSATASVPTVQASPGLFDVVMSDNRRRAILERPDGTFVSLENRARKGEILRAYVTGLGPGVFGGVATTTNQAGIPGVEFTPTYPVVVGVNNAGVRVVSVAYSPDVVGVYIVSFEVPAETPSGQDIPFVVAVSLSSGLAFSNPSSLPIQ